MKTIFLLPVFILLPIIAFAQNADSTVIKQVDSLIQVSRALTDKRDFNKALEVNAEAEKIALEKMGRESAVFGSCCFNRGRVNYFKRDYTEAEKWYIEAKDIREKALGKVYPDYANSLNNLGILYKDMGKYEKAEPLYLEIKAIREKVLGKEHPDYTRSLNNLAFLYKEMGKYEKAEPFYLESLAIFEKVLGKEHPDYANSLNNLGILYKDMGNYVKAEPLYLQAIAIKEKVLGKEHASYAWSLNALANLNLALGNYEKAEPLYLEAKAIRGKILGREHPDYATSLNNVAALYSYMSNYEKAEILFLEAKAIRSKVLGREHPEYASSLNNLANLYTLMGNYEKAEPLYLESKAIREKVLGKQHPDYASSLSHLATIYSYMGNYEKAEPIFLEAKAIREKVLGKEHPEYASSLHNLAVLYYSMGQYEKAEPLCLEAKDIQEKVLGKEHPVYAKSLNNLANLYKHMGNYKKAEPLYLETKAIQEKVLGKEHQAYPKNLNSLAHLYWTTKKFDAAKPYLLEAREIDKSLLLKAFRHLSERELTSYINNFTAEQNLLFSFTQTQTELSADCYNNTLFHKGFLLNAVSQVSHLALSDSVTTEKYYQLKAYNRRLAALYVKPIAERKGVSELEEKANTLEKELTSTVAGFGQAIKQVNWQEVQAALWPGESAIEFVDYKFSNPKTTDSVMYAALLVRPGDASPLFIPLFEEKQLNALLHTTEERRADYVSRLYTLPDRGIEPVEKTRETLYKLIWKPLEKELKGATVVYFSNSGLLHRLNLTAIPIRLDSVLGDRYQLVELGSTRSLAVGTKAGQLVVPNQLKTSTKNALLFGGIQYDLDSTALVNSIASIDSVSVASRGELNFFYTDSTLRVGTWGSLPFTDREVGNLERILKTAGIPTQTRRGYNATEEAFKTIGAGSNPSPRILHIATHGFFFPEPQTSEGFKTLPTLNEPVFKISEHPMIRSGLLLAGANHAWKTGKPLKPGMEDGILTAYEISQMNLSNTELVVLSACETGLGDIQGNEGVYGLQRAFKIAGAKYLIMSLWQVPDKQTSLLMTTFYKKWLPSDAEALAGKEQKMTIPEAFRAAQKELRDAGLDPYQWAGFVLVE
ncbi:MAG: tetratricopeptide repeat protein [Saprospiraceae bacterium]